MTHKVKGLDTILSNMGKKKLLIAGTRNDPRGALAAAIYQEASAIMGESVKEVPVDTGRLKNTHYVSLPYNKVGGVAVEMGYGTKYAWKQHEEHFDHSAESRRKRKGLKGKRTSGMAQQEGKRKYLEDPLNRHKTMYVETIAERTRRNIASGTTSPITKFPETPRTT